MLSLLLPTKRPQSFSEFCQSIQATARDLSQIEVVCRVDDTDQAAYAEISAFPFSVRQLVMPNCFPRLNEMWNSCWRAARGDIFMLCGDDIRFTSPDWDQIVVEDLMEFPNQIGFVFGPDGRFDQSLGTHGFVHRNWTDKLGYFTPIHPFTYFNDSWIDRVARAAMRFKYDPRIVVDHVPYSGGKMNLDGIHQRMLAEFERDKAQWDSLQAEIRDEAKKLVS